MGVTTSGGSQGGLQRLDILWRACRYHAATSNLSYPEAPHEHDTANAVPQERFLAPATRRPRRLARQRPASERPPSLHGTDHLDATVASGPPTRCLHPRTV